MLTACSTQEFGSNGATYNIEGKNETGELKQMSIQFRDLQRQYEHLKDAIDRNIQSVITSAHFISGSEVKQLESILADYVGVKHCITCGNGTDAISIALMASGIGEAGGGSNSDAVVVPDFTFFSSGECPAV